jgi:hypothetical protein
MTQPSASCLETFLNIYGKTHMSMHPKTATVDSMSHPTTIKPRPTMSKVDSTFNNAAACPFPSPNSDCHTAASTQRESITVSEARSTGRITTYGNESTDPLLGSSRSAAASASGQGAPIASASAFPSSPEGAWIRRGGDQGGRGSGYRPGKVHTTAQICKLTLYYSKRLMH